MKKLLIFIDWYLPGYKAGGPIVSIANLVNHLQADFEIYVYCSNTDYLQTRPYEGISYDQWINKAKHRVFYASPNNRGYLAIKKIISEVEPNTVYVNGIFSKNFSLLPLIAALRGKQRVVLAPRGMLAPGALAIKKTKKKIYLAVLKGLGVFGKLTFHATHVHEAAHIKNRIGKGKGIMVVPNLPSPPASVQRSRLKEANTLRILSVARIAREKNIKFALECIQEISSRVHVEAVFIGPVYDQDYYLECKKLKMPRHINLVFAGALPPMEIEKYYGNSDLFFLPTLGENFGHAIIEALLRGLPVLISDCTPWRNLQANGLGADYALEDKSAFINYLEEVGKMDDMRYREFFDHISFTAAGMINLSQSLAQYRKLFS